MVQNLMLESAYNDIHKRIENLQATNVRQWGKMDIAQMVAHCNVSLEQAIGKVPPQDKSNFLSKTLIKWVVLNKKPFGKNLPTVPSALITDERSFEIEKKRLIQNIEIFYAKLQKIGELESHPAFGKLSKEDWGLFMWKHLDHHLNQFSA